MDKRTLRSFLLFLALSLHSTGKGASSDVAIVLSSAAVNTTVGSTVLLACVSAATVNDTSSDTLEVTWEFSGNAISNSPTKYIIYPRQHSQNGLTFVESILQICDISFGEEGDYVCVASHQGVIQDTNITVNLLNGCPPDNITLPLIGDIEYPFTDLNTPDNMECPSIPSIQISRFCGEDGRWSNVDHRNCSQALTNQTVNQLLNITTITSREEAEEVTSNLTEVVTTASSTEDGETPQLLNVIDTTLQTLGMSVNTTTEKVVEGVLDIIDMLSTWQEDVVQNRSSSIVQSFEAIATNLTKQESFMNQTFSGEEVSYYAERREVEDLIHKQTSVKFNTQNGATPGKSSLEAEGDISSISLPASLFSHLINRSMSDSVGLVFTSYSSAILFPLALNNSVDFSTFIGSHVLGATVVSDQPVQDLAEPVIIKFKVDNLQNASFFKCVSWDFNAVDGRGNWTDSGCETSKVDDKFVDCRCNHLTNFAILMQICARIEGCAQSNKELADILTIASTSGVILSIICLIFTVITLAVLVVTKSRSSKERERESSVQYKFYIQLCIALLCMYVVFIAGIDERKHYARCVVVSVLIHYFTLVSVMWMTATCMFLFWIIVVKSLVKSKFKSRHMLLITALCWILPLVPVIIPVAINRDLVIALISEQIEFCFIKDEIVFFAAFLGPLLLLLLMNLVMYIGITFVQLRYICCIRKKATSKNVSAKKKITADFLTGLKVWCILSLFGLTWLFGAFTVTQTLVDVFSSLFAITTSLQGVFIFIFLCLVNKDALKCYKTVLFSRLSGVYKWLDTSQSVSEGTSLSSPQRSSSVPTQCSHMKWNSDESKNTLISMKGNLYEAYEPHKEKISET